MVNDANKKPLIEGLSLITGDNTQSKSNGVAIGILHNNRGMTQQHEWITHIATSCYADSLFLSTMPLVLIIAVPPHWPELAILAASPLCRVTLWDVGILKCVAHAWLMVRRALV